MTVKGYHQGLARLPGLGPKSAAMLAQAGVHTVNELLNSDAYDLYARICQTQPKASLNLLYALLGVQSQCHWQTVAKERKMEILQKLEQLGLLKN